MQIFKYQYPSTTQAKHAERLLQQIGHVRLGSTILIHIAHQSHVNAVTNLMAKEDCYTVSNITDYDLRKLWECRKPGGKNEFYFNELI